MPRTYPLTGIRKLVIMPNYSRYYGLRKGQPSDFVGGKNISWIGHFEKPRTIEEIEQLLNGSLSTTCKVLPFGPQENRNRCYK